MKNRTLLVLAAALLPIVSVALYQVGSRADPRALTGTPRTDTPGVGPAPERARLDHVARSKASSSQTVVVRVTTPEGLPIDGARIEFLGLGSNESGSKTSSATGEIRLPRAGAYVIRARSPGFAREPRLVALGDSSTIALTPVGSLEIRLPDVLPEAAKAIEVELLPPVAGKVEEPLSGRAAIADIRARFQTATTDRASSQWAQRYRARDEAVESALRGSSPAAGLETLFADLDRSYPYHPAVDPTMLRQPFANGRVRFDDLPAGPGYRYVVHAPFAIPAIPANEAPPVLFNEDGTFSPQNGLLPVELSGMFEIAAGTTLELRLVANTPGSVSGLLAGFDSTRDAANISIRHRMEYEHPRGGLTLTSARIESEVEPEPDGSFHVEPVPAGTKRIQIRHVTPGRHTAYIVQEFELAPGERRDLGVLEALGGSIVCTVGFVTEGGERLPPQRLFAGSESIGIAFTSPDSAGFGMADYLHVPLGEPFTLRGLAPGRYQLKAYLSGSLARRIEPPYAYDRDVKRTLLVDVEENEVTTVGFDLLVSEASTVVTVIATAPAGTEWSRDPDVRFFGEGKKRKLGLLTRRGSRRQGSLPLDPGPYRVVCNMAGDVNLQCVRDVVIPEGPEYTLELELVPGVIVRGRLMNANGSPAIEQLLQFALEPDGATVFLESTNAEGHFELSGIEPGTSLWVSTLDWTAPRPIHVPNRAGITTIDDLQLE